VFYFENKSQQVPHSRQRRPDENMSSVDFFTDSRPEVKDTALKRLLKGRTGVPQRKTIPVAADLKISYTLRPLEVRAEISGEKFQLVDKKPNHETLDRNPNMIGYIENLVKSSAAETTKADTRENIEKLELIDPKFVATTPPCSPPKGTDYNPLGFVTL